MKRLFSGHVLNVFDFEMETWPHPMHTHNFYELIFIESGRGLHRLNDAEFGYEGGNVFLLTPEDSHEFEIHEKTRFTYVKFTEQLFLEKSDDTGFSKWRDTVEKALWRPNVVPGDLVCQEEDRASMFQLMGLLKSEFKKCTPIDRQIVLELFGALMLIIVRNLRTGGRGKSQNPVKERERVEQMLSYIRQHVMEKEKVTLQAIADAFSLSPTYVTAFLKKHTGLTIRQIVMETKILAVERLLKQSDLTISQIAERLGFTDTSHLNKMFQKYRGVNPSDFR